mgnify:CR=1 FL=1
MGPGKRLLLAGLALLAGLVRAPPAGADALLYDRVLRRHWTQQNSEHRSRQDTAPPAVTDRLVSRDARAASGDTVRIGTTLYHLWGIAAPRPDEFGGYTATQALMALVVDASVACALTGDRLGGVAVARCKVGERDLSAEMVRQGMARDCPRLSGGTYATLERQVIASVSGGFELPEECRANY